MQIVPLQALRRGEVAEIVEVFGEDRLVARLAENGFRKGSRLEMLTPGEPLLCRIDEARLSLRTEGQVEVFVNIVAS